MCGIAGYYSTSGFFSEEDLRKMTSCLSHRGPDAEGYFTDGITGLGHRRLSIIDLSTRANQPMFSANGRFVIIYNGEVYNYSEIGARIQKNAGPSEKISFRTSSDTEIMIEAFARHGIDFVHELNGMFVFAIYDTELHELYLCRDRIGIKPLYYYWDGKNFAFASELKALRKLDKLNPEINDKAIISYLHLGFVPAPDSIFKKIYKLNSGCWLKISSSGIEIRRYWNLRNRLTDNVVTNKAKAMVRLSDLLISSVQYQLKSDVPFGVFLSGGTDSSLITAQAVMLSTVKVNTFSIGFEENSHNESEYAKAVAKHLGTDHHEFMVSHKDAMNLIPEIPSTYDEPFADSSSIPTMLVSKLARQYVTVTLSGEGGDELFYGYGSYKWASRLNNPLVKIFRQPAAKVFERMSSRYKRVAELLSYPPGTNLTSHIFSQEQYHFSEVEIRNLVDPDFYKRLLSNYERPGQNHLPGLALTRFIPGTIPGRKLKDIEMQALFDLEYYLQDDLLTKVDRASMKFSLETRVPYLDHRLIEFALNISPKLKCHNGTCKYILKQILYQYLPKRLFERPKQGFAIPLNKWLHTGLRFLVNDYLSEEVIRKHGIVNPEVVNQLKEKYYAGSDYLFNRLWILIVLHMWLEDFRK